MCGLVSAAQLSSETCQSTVKTDLLQVSRVQYLGEDGQLFNSGRLAETHLATSTVDFTPAQLQAFQQLQVAVLPCTALSTVHCAD